jgi:SulP family sulfate permease
MKEIYAHISTTNFYAVLVAMISLVTILVVPKIFKKLPGPLVGLVVSSLIANFFLGGKVTTIGSIYGQIPSHLPSFQLPELTIQSITLMLPAAFIIAMLGGIESLLSAVVADKMTGTKHNSNRELIGQGIANMVTPFFGGIPATGALARTAANIKNGASSKLSGVIHGVVVIIVLISLAPLASAIPIAAMAPVLMMVAWNMSEVKEFKAVLKIKNSDSVILLVTFLLTVFTNLTLAVEVGLVITLLWFVKRMSEMLSVTKGLPDPNDKNKVRAYMVDKRNNCPQISIFTVEGPLFFGVGQIFERKITENFGDSFIFILRMGKVPYMDTTGETHFENILRMIEERKGHIFISGLQDQPKKMLERSGVLNKIDEDHFFYHTGEAIDAALCKINDEKCKGCTYKSFGECEKFSMAKKIS